jgi:hypothetical protein
VQTGLELAMCSPGWPQNLILLPPPIECWGQSHVLPGLAEEDEDEDDS